MLGISDGNFVEHVEGEERPPDAIEEGIQFRSNQPDLDVIADGMDVLPVSERSADRYLVDYWGMRWDNYTNGENYLNY